MSVSLAEWPEYRKRTKSEMRTTLLKRGLLAALIVLILSAGLYSAAKRKMYVLPAKCVGCEDCRPLCPKKAITMKRGKAVINPDKCIGCKQCSYICSFGAITIK